MLAPLNKTERSSIDEPRQEGYSVALAPMKRNPLSLYLGLERDTYVLFVARLVNAMGSFVFPFLTLLLVKKLGFSPAEAGTIIFISAAANVPGSLIGGHLADRIGRKPVIVAAEAMVVVLFLICAFLGTRLVIVAFIIVAELALGAVWPATNALLTDRTTRENRQASFSLIYLGFNLGFAVGLFLAGILFENHLPWIFIGNALSTLVSMLLVLLFVKEPERSDEALDESPVEERAVKGNIVRVLLTRPYLLGFVGAIFLLNFVYAQINFTLPLQIENLFPKDGSTLYGTLMSVAAVYVVLLTPIVVALTKRYSPIANQIVAGLLYALGFGSIGYLHSFPLYLVAAFVWTIGEVLFATNASVYIANHSPKSHRGRLNAVLPLVMEAGFAFNPPLAGRYLAAHKIQSVWPLSFLVGIAAVCGLALLAFFEQRRKSSVISENLQP